MASSLSSGHPQFGTWPTRAENYREHRRIDDLAAHARFGRDGALSAGLGRSEARNYDITVRDRTPSQVGRTIPSFGAVDALRDSGRTAAQMVPSGASTQSDAPRAFRISPSVARGQAQTFRAPPRRRPVVTNVVLSQIWK
jgi:hypothetical protein